MITAQEFHELAAAGYTKIPIVYETLADLETPLTIYKKLADKPNSYLLESVNGGEKWARYSFIGLPCKQAIQISGTKITLLEDNQKIKELDVPDPLQWIEEWYAQHKTPSLNNIPRFTGGLVGYFGYDTIRYVEPRLQQHASMDLLNTPDILLLISNEIIVFDNLKHKLYFVVHADPRVDHAFELATKRIQSLQQQLAAAVIDRCTPQKISKNVTEEDFTSTIAQTTYFRGIEKIKQYILNGDVMQVVLSRGMSIDFDEDPLELYRALRFLNPSPYMYYFNLPDFTIVGASPELLVRVENRQIFSRPLAGTRPRGLTETEDLNLENELLADPKEIAEHLMLIDLGRNDISRVCETGSVRVKQMMQVEKYSHVMHISSNVTGILKKDISLIDAIRATLPAGTLSGAPKVRALEIIDELEPTKRGVYGGGIGYLSWDGNMDLAITLRTAVIKNKTLYTQAGGGIVADSNPAEEWQETVRKARAVLKSVALVYNNLKV